MWWTTYLSYTKESQNAILRAKALGAVPEMKDAVPQEKDKDLAEGSHQVS